MEQMEMVLEAPAEEPPKKQRPPPPPHVLRAILEGDKALLSIFGKKGGKVAGSIRHREAEARKALTALESGTIKLVKAKRPRKSSRKERKVAAIRLAAVLQALADQREDELAIEIDVLLWGLRKRQVRRQALHDAREHEKANLAGVSND